MNEEIVQKGLDVQEMKRTPGWVLVEDAIREEIELLKEERIRMSEDIAALVKEGKTLDQVGVEIAGITARIQGLESIFTIISRFGKKKTEAENKIRDNG